MSADKLLPCPFCQSSSALRIKSEDTHNHVVHCEYHDGGCTATGPWYATVSRAVSAWNTRAPDASDEEG